MATNSGDTGVPSAPSMSTIGAETLEEQAKKLKKVTVEPPNQEDIIKGAAEYAATMSLSYEKALMEVQITHDVAQIGRGGEFSDEEIKKLQEKENEKAAKENREPIAITREYLGTKVDNSPEMLEKRKKAREEQLAEMNGYFNNKAIHAERAQDFQNAIAGKIDQAFKDLEEQWKTKPVSPAEKRRLLQDKAREIAEAEVAKRYPNEKLSTEPAKLEGNKDNPKYIPPEQRLPGAVQYAYNPTDLSPAMMYLNEAQQRIPVVERVKADIEKSKTKPPTVSISAEEGEKRPTVSLETEGNKPPAVEVEGNKPPAVSIEAPSGATKIKTTPAGGKDQELTSDENKETEKKSLMAEAEVAGGKGWEDALERALDSFFGKFGEIGKFAAVVTFGVVGGALKIVSGGKVGGGFLKASGAAFQAMSVVQETLNRIVEIPKNPPKKPETESPKPVGEGGELSPRMNEAQRKLDDGQKQALGDDHSETRHLEAIDQARQESRSEMIERLDAEKQKQQIQQPESGAVLEADPNSDSSNKSAQRTK